MLRNVFTVLTGTVISQLIVLLGLPLLGRIYHPAEFGLFQIYISFLNIFLMLVAVRYEVGLLTVEDGKDFRSLLAVTLRLCFLTSFIVLGIVFAFHDMILAQIEGIGPVLWIFPGLLLVAGVLQTLTYLPIRSRNYRLAANYKIVQALGYVGVSIGLAFSPLFKIGIVVGDSVGRFLSVLWIWRNSPAADVSLIRTLKKEDALDALYQHRSLPIFTLPGTLLSAIAASLVPLAFAKLFSLETAGQYSLVERFILLPVGMLAFSVSQVFTGDLAETIRSNPASIHHVFRRLVRILGSVAIVGGVIGAVVLPAGVPFIFGEKWELAGRLAQLAMPLAAVTFVAAPINMVLLVAKRRKLQLLWEIGRFAAILAAFLWLSAQPSLEPETVMMVYVVTTALAYLVFLVMADRVLSSIARQGVIEGR